MAARKEGGVPNWQRKNRTKSVWQDAINGLVAIVLRFEGAFDREAQIVGLLLGKR